MTCISCGGPQRDWLTMPIDAKKNKATPYSHLVKCLQCGLGAVGTLPRPEEVPDFYNLESYYTHGVSHIPDIKPSLIDRILVKLAWLREKDLKFHPHSIAAMLPQGGAVCDLGCGHSQHLQAFRALGFDVVGVDPDQQARDYAAKHGIDVLPGTAEDIPDTLNGRKFDLVIMTHALEHCLDPAKAVRNVFTLVRPGGLFYCEVPNCGCDHFETFNISSEMFDLPRHLYFFTPDALRRLLIETGFVEVLWRWHGFVRDHMPGWRKWETTIAERARAADPALAVRSHTLMQSILLLARTLFAREARKYDSVGLLVRRPG